jgi:hypothetical protein
MPRYIIKLNEKYLEWSTVVDAPVSHGMTRQEFTDWYVREHGFFSVNELEERLQRADKKGVSALMYKDVDELIGHNRAGPNETCLTKDELIEAFAK